MSISVTYVTAFADNYIWLIIDEVVKKVIVVDPGDGEPVLDFLAQYSLDVAAVLLTHKHFDHSGGVAALLAQHPNVPVYAGAKDLVPLTTRTVTAGRLLIQDWATLFQVFDIPGHTLGHVAYYAEPFLFCGDTLFTGGCGRIFEGTPAQMLNSLQTLSALPDETLLYCGHEYTVQNLHFALQVEPTNQALQKRLLDAVGLRRNNQPTVPSTLALEKATNPFLRCDVPEVRARVSEYSGQTLGTVVDVFRELRAWKNQL